MSGKNADIKIKSVKSYIENDYETAYRKARSELGTNLVQMERKEVKVGGVFGLFATKKVQVTFGIEAAPIKPQAFQPKDPDNREILDLLKKMKSNSDTEKQTQAHTQNLYQNNQQPTQQMSTLNMGTYNPYIKQQQQTIQQPVFNSFMAPNVDQNNKTEEDPEQLKDRLKKEITEELKKELFQPGLNNDKGNDRTKELNNKLRESDVEEYICEEIFKYLKDNNFSGDRVLGGIREYFVNNIEILRSYEKKFIMLVGPTGVGKTTSCAKIVANKWREEKDVAFITADTYRLEAAAQLKAYANIMKVPVEVINSVEELSSSIDKLKGKDFVVMDTAGRSPKNKEQMEELKDYIRARGSDLDVHLVISATSKLSVLYEIIEKFKYIGFSSIIFTKIDETTSIGSILSIYKKYKIPVSYITTGQRVPDDIEIANKERLAEIFIEGLK